MDILIDIGNTRLKWACEDAGRLYDHGAMMVSDVSEARLQSAMEKISKPFSIWISNVGSVVVLDQMLGFLVKRYAIKPALVQVSEESCGVSNNYTNLESLGIDRWVAAIGARTLVGKGNVIVVDVGTAITIDWLSANNTYEGGVILPGTQLMHDSLVVNTAEIKSSYQHRNQIIGKTTPECVNSGVGFGLGGAVDRIIEEISVEIRKQAPELLKDTNNDDQSIELIVTGGGSGAIRSHAIDRAIVEPNLVLLGLQRIASETKEQVPS